MGPKTKKVTGTKDTEKSPGIAYFESTIAGASEK